MKRRDAVISIAGLGVGVTTEATSRLHGVPGSIRVKSEKKDYQSPFRIKIVGANKVNVADTLEAYSNAWMKLLGNKAEREQFGADPVEYLQKNGFAPELAKSNDENSRLLKAMLNEEVIKTSMTGDYDGFLKLLVKDGYISDNSLDQTNDFGELLSNQEVEDVLAKVIGRGNDDRMISALQYASNNYSTQSAAMVNVNVCISVNCAVYVNVATSVSVAVLAAVTVSVATPVAVAIGGWSSCELPGAKYAGPGAMLTYSYTPRQREAMRYMAMRHLLSKGAISYINRERLSDAIRVARLAKIVKNDDFQRKVDIQLVKDEVEAVIAAAQKQGILVIEDSMKQDTIKAFQTIALGAAQML